MMYELNCIFHQNIGKIISCEQPIIALDSKSSASSSSVSSLVLFPLSPMAIINLFPRRPSLPPEPRVFTFNHGVTRHYCLNWQWIRSYIFYIVSMDEISYSLHRQNGSHLIFFIFYQWMWSYQVAFSGDPKPSEGDKRQWNLSSVIFYVRSPIHHTNHYHHQCWCGCYQQGQSGEYGNGAKLVEKMSKSVMQLISIHFWNSF